MSGYGDVKRRRMKRLLKWLKTTKGVEVKQGGNHTILRCIQNGAAIPVPSSHSVVNKHIVKDVMEWCIKNGICTREEFDKRL
ncbi:MAG: hypothetical protein G01um101477_246 [Candidatus Doudnabacteria bacterium Gr01-1014_77]|uniref:YcfA family protein n=1 Tax=Candidatus Doudnabacteria bacterium Gr01-1014_77 TaxID=2017133 RepID=A0A554JCM4_9BACT|nr:MAG: hypothetical protein G01um101477_246 [Candidatus Doudnabacteria bacterium Gr01-1014_77]